MNWYPNKRTGLLCGLGLLLVLLLAGYWLARGLPGSPLNLSVFGRALLLLLILSLLLVAGYACYGLANLTYRVERNGLVIRWAASFDVVPMADIKGITPLSALGGRLTGGLGWPGYRIGPGQLEGVGPVRFYAAPSAEQALVVSTASMAYLICPADVEGFLADYRTRRLLGPIVGWRQELRLPALLSLRIWGDRLAAWLFLGSLLLNLALFGYLAARYSGLPPRLLLSYDARGLGDRIGARSELLLLPAVALGVLIVNGVLAAWVHRRERILALLLLCNVPLVQTLAWMAVRRLSG